MKQPLYYQIYSKLLSRINAGEYSPGDMLPTEQNLLETFGASRATVRQALGLLENEGIIERRPGKGTFVTSYPEELVLWFNFSPFKKAFTRNWADIHCKTVLAEMRRPPEDVRSFLMLGKKEDVMYLERIRFLKNRPVIFSQHYFLPSFDLRGVKNLDTLFSIRATLMEYFSLEVTRIDDTLSAVLPPEPVAFHLDIDTRLPLLLAERSSFSDHTPVQKDFFYTQTNIWNYHVVFEKGSRGTTAASAGKE